MILKRIADIILFLDKEVHGEDGQLVWPQNDLNECESRRLDDLPGPENG